MAEKFVPIVWRHLQLLVVVGLAWSLFWVMGPELAWSADKNLVVASQPIKASAKKTSGRANKNAQVTGQKPKPKPKANSKVKPVQKAKTSSTIRAKNKRANRAKTKPAGPDPEKLPFPENVKTLAGPGAVLITDNHVGRDQSLELFSLNPDKRFVPASILKVVTAGAALDALGLGYRFQTEFYLDQSQNLWVVGKGDPYLVAEELCLIMEKLRQTGLRQVKDIYLDSSYFQPGLILDGNTFTNNPYDAYNLALGVNFNTVNYLIDQKGKIVECNPCSPLTPVTLAVAERNRPKRRRKKNVSQEFRVNIASSPQDAEKNSGQMIKALLEKFQIQVTGQLILGRTLPKKVKLIYAHLSSKTLEEMIKELLKHSNNFMTNQIFLTLGAEKYGSPATPEKGRQAILDFLAKYELPTITMIEGSGLSRQNELTARQMARILGTMEPARGLLNVSDDGSVIYKTGTMSDIQTLAGYLVRPERINEPLAFVILLNGYYQPGTRDKILKALKAQFIGEEKNGSPAPSTLARKPANSAGAGLFAPAESTL
ncbi:MAG: D-alanyl-D-alanine carboxypeptidase [Deltaproteobacteria bacterium]|jgi:D-alanyl-D-alanine carboxypeptidase/D-alanyl-D-alanine-endopeptidase (penicillin-binding protein 4)|nr:D-alanyl-D-alanine carboxypeptidase [Deltaproteobacteria bacterium]